MTSVTPEVDSIQNFNITNHPSGQQALALSQVIKSGGTAIDLSAWTFAVKYRPSSNPNNQKAAASATGMTATGSNTGVLTIKDDGTFYGEPDSKQLQVLVLGTASGATNAVVVATGSATIADV